MNLEELRDHGLTPAQRDVRQAARTFAQREVAPGVDQAEREGRYPLEKIRRIGELGYLGIITPEQYGGAGLDTVSYGVICEEVGAADWVCASAISVANSLVGSALLRFGSEEQKQRFLTPLASGRWIASACFTEPQAGSDLASIATTARREGDSYVLHGEKAFISHANHANLFLVLATLDPSQRHRAITAFLVERESAGLETTPMAMHVLRRGDTAQIRFEDVRVPVGQRLGEEGEGFKVVGSALDVGRFSVASRCVGQAQACLDAAIDYARQREQFGQPIGKFQLVQGLLADMITSVEAARLLVRRVGQLKDQGLQRASFEASMAKLYASEVCMRVAEQAVQIMGGYGLTAENPIGRYFQEAKVLQIGEGSNQLQQALVAEYALGYRRG